MGFLWATGAAIGAGITIPLLVSLYFLKLRRRRVTVSSTQLWSQALDDLRVNTPFQKLRRNLLLLLQLLILVALLLALARPTLRRTTGPGARLILMLDHSASMNATDAAPSRLEHAKRLALELVDAMATGVDSAGSAAMVISFADEAQVVEPFTADPLRLRRAIRSIPPTDLSTDFSSALRVIEPLLGRRGGPAGGQVPVVYVLSDGRMQDTEPIAAAGVELRYLKVGHRGDNLAIVSLAGRRQAQRPGRVEVLARIANFGDDTVSTNLVLSVDRRVRRVVPITVTGRQAGAPGAEQVRFDLEHPASGLLELRCDRSDALEADNTAFLSLAPRRLLDVLLVTAGNPFLAKAIEATAVRRLAVVTPGVYEQQNSEIGQGDAAGLFDVVVFDRYKPGAVPPANSLSFDAALPLEAPVLQRIDPKKAASQIVLNWNRDHPLMAHVGLDDLVMDRPAAITLPDGGEVLAVGPFGPVMARVSHGGRDHVIVGFDLVKSNWPLQVSFPVFIRNAMVWLGGRGGASGPFVVRTGAVLAIPDRREAEPLRYERADSVGGPPFTRVGLYRATTAVSEPWDQIGVSLLDRGESDLEPVDQITLEGSDGATIQSTPAVIRREIWWWFASAALVLLMVEWVVYTRAWAG